MKRAAAAVAIVAAAMVLTACGDSGGSIAESDLPTGWVEGGEDERELAQNATDLAPGAEIEVISVYYDERTAGTGFATNVNVLSEEIPGDVDLAEYQDTALDELRRGGFGDVEDAGSVEIAGEEARVVEYLPPKGSPIKIKVRVAITIHDGTGYAFTLTAADDEFDSASQDFDEILASWEWSD